MTLDGGVIVVGMNPGHADDDERRVITGLFDGKHDLEHAYSEYLVWLASATQRIPFYTLMRAALATMGFVGPILWTEVVKCESGNPVSVEGKEKPVPFHLGQPFLAATVSVCRDKYLRAELALCPPEWPIVAASLGVGDYLEETRTELANQRPIIAVPHPTGSDDFLKIFVPTGLSASPAILEQIRTALVPGSFARLSWRSGR